MSPDRWRRLLKPAMRGDITLSQFETRFMRVWRETRERGERNPKPIEDLFHYVENYIPDRKLMSGSKDVDDQQLHAALRRAHASLAPKGVLGFMKAWFSVLPIFIALTGAAVAQEIAPPAAPAPPAIAPAPPPPNPIAVLEECVRIRSRQLEISKEAADLVAVAAIQKCNRELTSATMISGTRSLQEARTQLKDAMREIAITEVVDLRTARNAPPPPPPPPKAEEAKPKPPVRRRTVRRAPAAKPAVVAPKPVAAPKP